MNKTDVIDSTYRFFKMEVLAGENNMIAEVVCLSSKYLFARKGFVFYINKLIMISNQKIYFYKY